MLYNKDTEYNIKYITVDGDKKEITYTPEKDMSVPEIINMLQDKDKDFYKLLKEESKVMESKKLNEYIENGGSISPLDITEFDSMEELEEYVMDNGYDFMEEPDEFQFRIYDPRESDGNVYVYDIKTIGDKITIHYDPRESYSMNESVQNKESNVLNEDEEIELQDADIEPEDTTETQLNMEQAVQELEDITEEEKFGIDTIASTIDVLIADEQSAIDGYNSFLEQCKETIPEELYNTIEKELQEIIQDEEDHINKLVVIQESLNTDIAPSENTDIGIDMEDVDTVEENKQLEENSSHTFKYNKDDTVPYKGKEYKIVKVIPAHYWKGQNASDEEGEDNSFVEFTDDMYEIQNPKNSSDWGYVKATQLNETYELTPKEEAIQTKYDQVLDELEIDLDSPAEVEEGHMIKKYIINHPEASVDEIVELYNNYTETGDTTILENKKLNESDKKMYADLAEKMEKEIYNYLIENEFNPFDIDPDNGFADESLSEILEDYQSNIIEEYMKNHNVELMWECDLNHFKPYGIEVTIWEV